MPEIINLPKPQPINSNPSGLLYRKKLIKSRFFWPIIATMTIIISLIAGIAVCYFIQLSPVGGNISDLKKVVIAKGSTSSQIGKQLEQASIIRSAVTFDIYARINGKNNTLQAGTYRLSPAESTPQIIQHLVNGSVDKFKVTFLPGGTLSDAIKTLKKAGYSDNEITTGMSIALGDALASNNPLFAGRPSSADLEGYVFGETYNFNTGVKVQDILKATFTEFDKQIQDNNLVKSFANHGLNLYQGITLASIVQKEASGSKYQGQVAQVFYLRLAQGMMLGSDVTYQYIADKTGVARDPNINSPYNTRRFVGLPPGPIATPGLSALKAVANPAEGDYMYFLAGDDGIVYFAHTLDEHESNITNHCKVNCSTP